MPGPLTPISGKFTRPFFSAAAIAKLLSHSTAALHSLVRSYGVCLSAVLIGLLALLSHQQQLQWLDQKLLHAALQFTPARIGQPQVLLLEAPYAELAHTPPNWHAAVQAWLAQGVQKVAISVPLSHEQEAQLQDLVAQHKLVLASKDASAARTGYWQAAANATQTSNAMPNYRMPAAALPSMSLQRAVNEGILPTLAQQKVILVGYAADANLRTLPWSGSAQGISQLRQDAVQVDSLLQGNGISYAAWSQRMLLASLTTAILLLLWQRMSFKFGLAQWLGISLLASVSTTLVLAQTNFWLPLAEILLAISGTFCAVFYAKMQADDKQLRQLIRSTSGKLNKLALPPTIFHTPDHWQFILGLIDQTLHVKRVILLEKIPGKHHLREVHALHQQGLPGLREMRRDHRRAPYSSALRLGTLFRVENFLTSGEDDAQDEQYVLPLLLNGELMGFLALAVAQQEADYFAQQSSALAPIANQVAKLLYQRQLWLNQQSQPRWQRWLRDSNNVAFQKLTQALSMMEQRLALLEHSFAQGTHAAIVYDLFGRVLLANRHMQQRLAHSSVGLQNLNASHFLARLAGKELPEVRLAMQQLILQHSSFTWPVCLPELLEEHLLLRVSVLTNETAQPHPDSVQPFNLAGILVEVMDISEMMVSVDAHAEVRQQAAQHLHEELQNLPALLRALQHDKLAPAIQQRVLAALQEKADSIAAISVKSRLLLEDSNRHACYPLDITALLPKMAQEASLQTALTQKNVQLTWQFHRQPAHVFGVPRELQFCLQAITQLLLLDASSDSVIHFSSSEDSQHLSLICHNDGYGISNQKLQESLRPTATPQAKVYAQAREAQALVASWGGGLTFSSAIGAGTQAHLRLCAFCWRSPASEAALLAQIANARAKQAALPRPRLVK